MSAAPRSRDLALAAPVRVARRRRAATGARTPSTTSSAAMTSRFRRASTSRPMRSGLDERADCRGRAGRAAAARGGCPRRASPTRAARGPARGHDSSATTCRFGPEWSVDGGPRAVAIGRLVGRLLSPAAIAHDSRPGDAGRRRGLYSPCATLGSSPSRTTWRRLLEACRLRSRASVVAPRRRVDVGERAPAGREEPGERVQRPRPRRAGAPVAGEQRDVLQRAADHRPQEVATRTPCRRCACRGTSR